MDTIAIYTQAHNAEKTLRRTIDSVLNQTYKNFIYYIGDNCSTDKTRKIILEYAAKDKRIVPILYDGDGTISENIVANLLNSFKLIAENENVDYFCNLDADDTYHKDFFEKSLGFLKKNNLDIVAAGSNFIDAASKKIIGVREIKNDLVIFGLGYGEYLPCYHCFMRTVWGKIYNIRCFRKMLDEGLPVVAYGLDTIITFETLRHSNRAGILKGTYHDYYLSKKSSSYVWFPNRDCSDWVINSHVIKFLIEKVGFVSENNRSFLDAVYINGITDTMNVLLKCNNSIEDKLKIIRNIIGNEYTISAFTNKNTDSVLKKSFLDELIRIIASFPETKTNPDGIWLGLNISAFAENQDLYMEYSFYNISYLIDNNNLDTADKELKEWESILPENNTLIDLRRRIDSKKHNVIL